MDLPPGHASDLLPFLPDFTFRIIQLAALPFDAIRGTPSGIMTLRVMKAERIAELLSDPVWDETLLSQLPRETLEFLIRYILRADIDKHAFDRKLKSITGPQLQSTAMSLAQQLRQEGRQEGWQKAITETLEIRFEVIPSGLAEAIREIHEEPLLSQLLRQALTAPSLETFAHGL